MAFNLDELVKLNFDLPVEEWEEPDSEEQWEVTVQGGEDSDLHLAIERDDQEEVVRLLKKGARNSEINSSYFVIIRNPDQLLPLQLAVQLGHYEMIAPLVEYGSETKMIYHSIQKSPKREECLKEFLKLDNFDINDIGLGCRTFLHTIVVEEPQNIEFMEMLIRCGADINCYDHLKNNILHTLCRSNFDDDVTLKIAYLFLERGIEVDALNQWEETPLQSAIIFRKQCMIQPLLKYGAIVGEPTYNWPTLLHEAKDRNSQDCLTEMIVFILLTQQRQTVENNLLGRVDQKFIDTTISSEIENLKLLKIPNTSLSYFDLMTKPRKASRNMGSLEFQETLDGFPRFKYAILTGLAQARLASERYNLENVVIEKLSKTEFKLMAHLSLRRLVHYMNITTLERIQLDDLYCYQDKTFFEPT